MPGRELRATTDGMRGLRRLRRAVLAAVLATFVTFLAAGVASADEWPHDWGGGQPTSSAVQFSFDDGSGVT